MQYGRSLLLGGKIYDTRVSIDGAPNYKVGGITLDLAVIPAAISAQLTLPDGSVLDNGAQYLRFGQVLCQETGYDVQTITITGTATGGNFTLTYSGVSSGAISWNATPTQVEAALLTIPALAALAPTFAGGPLPGTGITMTTPGQPAVLAVGVNSLTGTTPAPVVTHTTTGTTTSSKWGPYDPAASDGRQTLSRGRCVILDKLWLANPGVVTGVENIGGVFDGGNVWINRVLQAGTGTHSLAAGPTLAELLTAFPRLTPVYGQ